MRRAVPMLFLMVGGGALALLAAIAIFFLSTGNGVGRTLTHEEYMRLSSGVAARLMKDRETPIAEVCEAVGVFRATLYRYLKPDGTLRQLLKTPPA
jgi:hypothetical protein